MSFPIFEVEDHSSPPPASDTGGEQSEPAPQFKAESCPACDGSGLWRGIDGYVFKCPHCCFEMT